MPRRTPVRLFVAVGALTSMLCACATGRRERIEAEFPEVAQNCGLPHTRLVRDARDKRLVHLEFLDRSAVEIAASMDGRLSCITLWTEERGFRLQAHPDEGTSR
jgi:hypothetical protein